MPSPEALITCEWCGAHLGQVDDATTLGRLRELVASHRCLFPYDQLWLRVESGTISQRIWQDRRRAAGEQTVVTIVPADPAGR